MTDRLPKLHPLNRKCNLEMKPVAVILTDKELVRLLNHLGLPAEFPVFKPAPKVCGPPDDDCQLDPRTDLYEEIDPAPADDWYNRLLYIHPPDNRPL
jgi:hypothetical protein